MTHEVSNSNVLPTFSIDVAKTTLTNRGIRKDWRHLGSGLTDVLIEHEHFEICRYLDYCAFKTHSSEHPIQFRFPFIYIRTHLSMIRNRYYSHLHWMALASLPATHAPAYGYTCVHPPGVHKFPYKIMVKRRDGNILIKDNKNWAPNLRNFETNAYLYPEQSHKQCHRFTSGPNEYK